VVSKRQIAFESKAQADEKAQHTLKYVSILKRSATQLSDARWGFETTSTYPSPSQLKTSSLMAACSVHLFQKYPEISSSSPERQCRSGVLISSWLFDGLLKNV
jgi:hypothetical protein